MDTVTTADMAIAMGLKGGLGILHRFTHIAQQVEEVKRVKEYGCIVGAAVGVRMCDGEIERALRLIAAGCDLIVIDVAHGHSLAVADMVKRIKINHPYQDVCAGNVATNEGAVFLAKAGADIIKVGIGPGAVCTTRKVTGFGVPQLTAIEMVKDALVRNKFPDVKIIADGGIRSTGDIVKALAVGADAVMLGRWLAGCDEAPGEIIEQNGKKLKVYRGMASKEAILERADDSAENQLQWRKVIPEGISAVVPYQGSVVNLLSQIEGELRSALSYGGALNIKALQQDPVFLEVTSQGFQENNFHDVSVLEKA